MKAVQEYTQMVTYQISNEKNESSKLLADNICNWRPRASEVKKNILITNNVLYNFSYILEATGNVFIHH